MKAPVVSGAALLANLRGMGLTVRRGRGDELLAGPKELLTPSLRVLIRQAKAKLLEALGEGGGPPLP